MRNLIIFGDTPFAERLFKYISIEAKDKIIAFTQQKSFVSRKEIQGVPVVPFEELDEIIKEEFEIVIGIGYTKMNQLKRRIYNKCKVKGYKIATYVSSNALLYSDKIAEGCFIAPGCVVGTNCRVGACNFLESFVVLSHDNSLGEFNFLSTNVVLGGYAKIEDNCFFGLHCTVKDNISIASNNLFGSCANVIKSINDVGGVFVGNPTRRLVGKVAINTKI